MTKSAEAVVLVHKFSSQFSQLGSWAQPAMVVSSGSQQSTARATARQGEHVWTDHTGEPHCVTVEAMG